ncbi:MAG: PD40 domain-containing protein, partial [Bacteroidales bacterium]|nr:PD40 domain-containing protein [Bacteroidales bacterium]
MRKTNFLTLIAIFVALFANFGTFSAQAQTTFKCLQTLEGHSFAVSSVCWSPDGKYLASGSGDKTVIIWEANSGEILKTLEGHSYSVYSVSWSPDGKYLASGSWEITDYKLKGIVKIWDLNSGGCIQTLEGHSDIVKSVCWSP